MILDCFFSLSQNLLCQRSPQRWIGRTTHAPTYYEIFNYFSKEQNWTGIFFPWRLKLYPVNSNAGAMKFKKGIGGPGPTSTKREVKICEVHNYYFFRKK